MKVSDRRPLGGSGLEVTAASYGGGSLGNFYRRIGNADAAQLMQAVWDCGIRYFDTAPFYGRGRSERRIGAFLGDQPRADFVLSTKVGRILEPAPGGADEDGIFFDPAPFNVRYDYSYDGVMRSHEHSLQRLGLERVDILYVHDIDRMIHGADTDYHLGQLKDGGIRALEELRSGGAIAAYGLGVNEIRTCLDCLDYADPDAFLLAGRFTLLEQSAALPLLERCVERAVSVVVGSVFNSGILATGAVAGARYNYDTAPAAVMESVRQIEATCAAHDTELASAALQFPLSHPAVASVLLGVGTLNSLRRSVAGFEAEIPRELWQELAQWDLQPPAAIGN